MSDNAPRPIPFTTADMERLEQICGQVRSLEVVPAVIAFRALLDELRSRTFTDVPEAN